MADGLDFTAEAFAKMDASERIHLCRRLAARARKLADLSTPKERDGYLLIARQWDQLGSDIEQHANDAGQP